MILLASISTRPYLFSSTIMSWQTSHQDTSTAPYAGSHNLSYSSFNCELMICPPRLAASSTVNPREIHGSYNASWDSADSSILFLDHRPQLETYCNFDGPITAPSPLYSFNSPLSASDSPPALSFSPSPSASPLSLPCTPFTVGISRKRSAGEAFEDSAVSYSNCLQLEIAPSKVTDSASVAVFDEDRRPKRAKPQGLSVAQFWQFLLGLKYRPKDKANCPLCAESKPMLPSALVRHLYEGNGKAHFHLTAMALHDRRKVDEHDLAIAICIAIAKGFELPDTMESERKKARLTLSDGEDEARTTFVDRVVSFSNSQNLLLKDNHDLLIRFEDLLTRVAARRFCDRCHQPFGRLSCHKDGNYQRCKNKRSGRTPATGQ